jgi:hypothetical protein
VNAPDQSAQGTRATPDKRTRALRRLGALTLGALLAIAVVEGGWRAILSIRGAPYDGERSESRLNEFVARLEGLDFAPKESAKSAGGLAISLHPYDGFQLEELWKRADTSESYFQSQAGRENFDILLTGGSVAAGFHAWASTALIPLLAADPRLSGRTIIVHKRACPALKQPQLATDLEWAFSLGIQPDVVLLLDGFNELAVSAGNAEKNVHPLFPAWFQAQTSMKGPLSNPAELEVVADIFEVRRSAEQLAETAQRRGLMRSAVLGGFVEREFASLSRRSGVLLARLEKLTAQRSEERPLFVRGPPFVNEPENVLHLSVQAWVEGARSMEAACRARSIPFVHVLQPAARDIGSKPLTENEDRLSLWPTVWKAAIETGYPHLREAGAQLAREGYSFHDASRVFADHREEIYLDSCHMEGVGNTILGQFIARAVLDSLPKEQARK